MPHHPLPARLPLYCPKCHCTRAAIPKRTTTRRKTGKRATVVEVTCSHCRTRIQYGMPPQEEFYGQANEAENVPAE